MVVEWLGEELRTFRGPSFVAGANVCHAKIEEAAHPLQILGRSEPYIGLVGRRTTAGVEDDPGILQLDVAGIFPSYDSSSQDAGIEFLGFLPGLSR